MTSKRRDELIPTSRQDATRLRRTLQNIVTGAIPFVAAAALTASCNVVIKLNEEEISQEYRTESVRESIENPPEEPRTGEEPPTESKEPVAETSQETVTDADHPMCPPFESGFSSCGLTQSGHLQKALAPIEPQPLSKERCMQLCLDEVYAVCGYPRDWGAGGGEVVIQASVKKCEEGAGMERNIVCDYTLYKLCRTVGRLPAGLSADAIQVSFEDSERGRIGKFFAEIACLEMAAVTAFRYLVEELRAYDAPDWMIAWAQEGVEEEIEHAEMTEALALRYGVEPRYVDVAPFALRSLADIAYDNAREGCVRETYGSLMAYWQAATADDPAVRAVMERIAHEESRHSALSWAIEAWVLPQLSEAERQTYKQLQHASLGRLQEELLEEPDPVLVKVAGVPTATQGLYLFAKLQEEFQALYSA
jgi:hypothetical protein